MMTSNIATLLKRSSLGIAAAIALLVSAVTPTAARAQLTPDGTLGDESSVVTEGIVIRGDLADLVEGGTTRGGNLFHSFFEFNVNDEQRVYFANPDGIVSILSRITGSDSSNIFGTLGVDGSADLFLMNPNGIVFGPNSSLDVSGSFVGTTADAIQFDEQGLFTANDLASPTTLTVAPSALWFNQLTPNSITNASVAPTGSSASETPLFGLRAPTDRSLLLVGGDINMTGGRIIGSGSRIELGGMAEPGVVGLEADGNYIRLAFPEAIERSDITLSNDGLVGLVGPRGGDIVVYTDTLTAISGGRLVAAIEGEESGSNITVDANQIDLSGFSSSFNSGFLSRVLPGATGNAGEINVDAESITIQNGAQISSTTFGAGNSGQVNITADSIEISGESENASILTGIGSTSETIAATGVNATGIAGDVTVSSRLLSIRDGGQITTSTSGGGAGGTLSITAREATELVGSGNSITGVTSSGLNTQTTGDTDAGRLRLETGRLSIREGALVNASTFGAGAAGDVEVIADTIEVSGIREDQLGFSAIQSTSGLTIDGMPAAGAAGDVSVSSRLLSIRDGGQITTSTFGGGAGGTLSITAREATELVGSGNLTTGVTSSGLNTQTTGDTDAGRLRLETGRLSIREGALINASTFGAGAAGDVEVIADTIEVSGIREDQLFSSTIQSTSGQTTDGVPAAGAAGNVSVSSRLLSIRDGGQITTSTSGEGAGGTLSITAREATELVGSGNSTTGVTSSGLNTQTTGDTDAGSLRLETGRLSIREGALINASTFGAGAAGDVEVIADTIEVSGIREDQLGFSAIQSTSGLTIDGMPAAGAAGDVSVSARQLSVRDGGRISTETLGGGSGGNLFITVRELTELVGSENIIISFADTGEPTFGESSSGLITQTTGTADAGRLKLETGQLLIQEGALIDASTFGAGAAGDVEVIADTIEVSGIREDQLGFSAIRSTSGLTIDDMPAAGAAGDVTVLSRLLSIRDGGQITTSTSGGGAGGTLSITAREATELVGSGNSTTGVTSSGLNTQTTGDTDAGRLRLETGQLSIREGALINASTFGAGAAGNVEVIADSIDISGIREDQLFSSTIQSTSGQTTDGVPAAGAAGNVSVSSRLLSIRDGGQITTSTSGGGAGGTLSITAREATELVGSGNSTTGVTSSGLNTQTTGDTDAGSLRLETGRLSIQEGALINASTFGAGAAGDVEVIADTIEVSGIREDQLGFSAIRSTSGQTTDGMPAAGAAGDVSVSARQLSVRDGGRISTETLGGGSGGNLFITVRELTELVGSENIIISFADTGEPTFGESSSGLTTQTTGTADAGRLKLETGRLSIQEGATINASTFGAGAAGDVEVIANSIDISGIRRDQLFSSSIQSISGQLPDRQTTVGNAGDIAINVRDRLEMRNGDISTISLQAAGGDIRINTDEGFSSGVIVLRDDSDITTSSQRNGGTIEIRSNAIVAFDDSDILTTSEDESGGDITLGNFFSERDPFNGTSPLDGNDRVDINAEGRIASGNISTPNVSFIENSLNELSGDIVDTDALTARSCIARNGVGTGSFIITSEEGRPEQLGSNTVSAYPTGTIQTISEITATPVLQEPQDIYQLADGRLVLSYQCKN